MLNSKKISRDLIENRKGKELLKIARNSIKSAFEGEPFEILKTKNGDLNRKNGAFVSLYHLRKDKILRGCIGYIKSPLPLWKTVSRAARFAAFEDRRFPPLQKSELKEIIIEISVLTIPSIITIKRNKPEERIKEINVGGDGLIVEYHGFSGLLLPQVPLEYGWDAKKFLEETCRKAGIPPNSWKDEKCKIYKFQAQIFSEN